MLKRSIITSIVGAAALAAASSAQAFVIQAGTFRLTLESYDSGTLYVPGTPSATPLCDDTLECDADAVTPAPGGVDTGNGIEDSWGILSVAAITKTSPAPISTWFSRPTGGATVDDGYIIGLFYGLVDQNVQITSTSSQRSYSTGGYIDLYLSDVDYDPYLWNGSNRTDVENQITANGTNTLWLRLQFALGADGTTVGLTSTYVADFNTTTATIGSGGWADVIGGAAQYNFDTNTSFNPNTGGFNDVRFTTTLQPDDTGTDWLAINATQATGLVQAPEPGTLALLGLGLGLAGLSRRRKVA